MKHRASLDRVIVEKETLDRGELEGLLADVKPVARPETGHRSRPAGD